MGCVPLEASEAAMQSSQGPTVRLNMLQMLSLTVGPCELWTWQQARLLDSWPASHPGHATQAPNPVQQRPEACMCRASMQPD